ncbi:dihydroneopterin aldolase [Aliifodinibius sp. S!AR15-10]|uniref:dihydroneopterin aldolase n=1 Tax=Aliifodinibius sp. S!AR15-10 TaxID=2950437 RepID=UPI0028585E32|nr:dihydroneopterin aldolase [Aliifodinibius sp. S!AR15-10]MDR8392871.1 dihydroneopterin aldolase [Aliifodinibius sp. S!AR15-10]
MDTLRLNGLQYHARHGFYEEERTNGNDFEIDLEFSLDLRGAGQTDDLDKTVNYEEVEAIVRSVMEGPSQKLIETLTYMIGEALFEQFPEVIHLEVSLRKLNPPLQTKTKFSEVIMTWQRQL